MTLFCGGKILWPQDCSIKLLGAGEYSILVPVFLRVKGKVILGLKVVKIGNRVVVTLLSFLNLSPFELWGSLKNLYLLIVCGERSSEWPVSLKVGNRVEKTCLDISPLLRI